MASHLLSVGPDGRYTEERVNTTDMHIREANKVVVENLKERGCCLQRVLFPTVMDTAGVVKHRYLSCTASGS